MKGSRKRLYAPQNRIYHEGMKILFDAHASLPGHPTGAEAGLTSFSTHSRENIAVRPFGGTAERRDSFARLRHSAISS